MIIYCVEILISVHFPATESKLDSVAGKCTDIRISTQYMIILQVKDILDMDIHK